MWFNDKNFVVDANLPQFGWTNSVANHIKKIIYKKEEKWSTGSICRNKGLKIATVVCHNQNMDEDNVFLLLRVYNFIIMFYLLMSLLCHA